MTTPRHPRRSRDLLLRDILEWSDRLADHLRGARFEGFATDLLVQDAVVRCIAVVGEAAGRILAEPLDPVPEPLRHSLRMAYMTRNWLVHGYADLVPTVIWDTATQSVPALAAAIRAVIPPDPA